MTASEVPEHRQAVERATRPRWHFLAALGAVAIFGWWTFAGPGGGSALERISDEHSLVFPASTSDVAAGGDASNWILRTVGLDRGASSLLVIDRSDLPALLAQIPGLDEQPLADNPAPGNRQYQHSSVPWDTKAEATYLSHRPPTGDFIELSVFPMDGLPDSERVGIWLYTDWN